MANDTVRILETEGFTCESYGPHKILIYSTDDAVAVEFTSGELQSRMWLTPLEAKSLANRLKYILEADRG